MPSSLPAADVEARPPPDPAKLARVSALARDLAKARLLADKALEEAKKHTDAARAIEERALPDALRDAGVASLPLGKGWCVEIERFANGSVSEANADAAWSWLEADGEGDLVKHVVTVSFGRDSFKAFMKFLRDLAKRRKPIEYEVDRTVHATTLRKFIKDRAFAEARGDIAPERRLPRDLFSIHEGTRAVLVGPEDSKRASK